MRSLLKSILSRLKASPVGLVEKVNGRLVRVPRMHKNRVSFERVQVRNLSDEAKAKISSLTSATELPLETRRVWYNALARRMKDPCLLKPGVIEKYNQCLGSHTKRWELLKEYMLCENLRLCWAI